MLRPPKQLAEQIHQLHAPLREMNRKFMARLVATLPLRPGLDREKVARYLESVGSFLQNAMAYYQGREGTLDLHAMLENAGEWTDMILFGVFQQVDPLPAKAPSSAR